MYCKHCGEDISPEVSVCPNCGETVKELRPTPEQVQMMVTHDGDVPPPPPQKSKKGLAAPLATVLVSVAGWFYILTTNTINSVIGWFTSNNDMGSNLSDRYEYFGNTSDELWGNIAIIAIMAILALLGVVGVIWLLKRLANIFIPKKRK